MNFNTIKTLLFCLFVTFALVACTDYEDEIEATHEKFETAIEEAIEQGHTGEIILKHSSSSTIDDEISSDSDEGKTSGDRGKISSSVKKISSSSTKTSSSSTKTSSSSTKTSSSSTKTPSSSTKTSSSSTKTSDSSQKATSSSSNDITYTLNAAFVFASDTVEKSPKSIMLSSEKTISDFLEELESYFSEYNECLSLSGASLSYQGDMVDNNVTLGNSNIDNNAFFTIPLTTNEFLCMEKRYVEMQKDVNPSTVMEGSFVDERDQSMYMVVKIGSQVWMAQNLNYADPPLKNCNENCDNYGLLYSWNDVLDGNDGSFEPMRGVCPEGWHIPSAGEIDVLLNAVGGEKNARWNLSNADDWGSYTKVERIQYIGSNAYGFNALPSAYYSGKETYHQYTFAMWSSTHDGNDLKVLKFDDNLDSVLDVMVETNKLSVRCVYDKYNLEDDEFENEFDSSKKYVPAIDSFGTDIEPENLIWYNGKINKEEANYTWVNVNGQSIIGWPGYETPKHMEDLGPYCHWGFCGASTSIGEDAWLEFGIDLKNSDVSDWGGVCVTYQTNATEDFSLYLSYDDEIDGKTIEYNFYSVVLPYTENIVKTNCFSLTEFKQGNLYNGVVEQKTYFEHIQNIGFRFKSDNSYFNIIAVGKYPDGKAAYEKISNAPCKDAFWCGEQRDLVPLVDMVETWWNATNNGYDDASITTNLVENKSELKIPQYCNDSDECGDSIYVKASFKKENGNEYPGSELEINLNQSTDISDWNGFCVTYKLTSEKDIITDLQIVDVYNSETEYDFLHYPLPITNGEKVTYDISFDLFNQWGYDINSEITKEEMLKSVNQVKFYWGAHSDTVGESGSAEFQLFAIGKKGTCGDAKNAPEPLSSSSSEEMSSSSLYICSENNYNPKFQECISGCIYEKKTNWELLNSSASYDIMKDSRDDNYYKTIVIGSQTWMAENLNYADSNETSSLTNGRSVCYGDDESNCKTYGRLYTWAAAIDSAKLEKTCGYYITCEKFNQIQGICPEGWHLPSQDEWGTLMSFVGDSVGKKLKSSSGWDGSVESADYNGLDEFGFTALPAGIRYDSYGEVIYAGLKMQSSFWSSTEIDQLTAYGLTFLDYDVNVAENTSLGKKDFYSVRCIKDSD